MEDTPISIEFTNTFLRKGNYEGHDYYQMIATTPEGFTLKTKLTAFEYQSIMRNLNNDKAGN